MCPTSVEFNWLKGNTTAVFAIYSEVLPRAQAATNTAIQQDSGQLTHDRQLAKLMPTTARNFAPETTRSHPVAKQHVLAARERRSSMCAQGHTP